MKGRAAAAAAAAAFLLFADRRARNVLPFPLWAPVVAGAVAIKVEEGKQRE